MVSSIPLRNVPLENKKHSNNQVADSIFFRYLTSFFKLVNVTGATTWGSDRLAFPK